MTAPRLALLVLAIVAGILIWRHIRQREFARDSYECQMLGGSVSECMRSRGWGDREAADALIQDLRRRYP